MRMRRKKNLQSRFLEVSNEILRVDTSIKNVTIANQNKQYIDYEKVFGRQANVCLEVGCGKGGFIKQLAARNTDKDYFAVESMENIIIMACENVKKNAITNVKFLNIGAEYLPRYIRSKSIETIYLNFSPPYPQNSYECRRLTNERYIEVYKEILNDGGKIEQKTDDKDFFEYSVDMFKKCGFRVFDVSKDLINDKDNIVTEYENKFRMKGLPIYKLIAFK